jgi:carboxyl-terminal processing protease
LEKSKERLNKNIYFKLIDEQARWIKEQQENYLYSLNYEKYNSKRIEDNLYSKRFEKLNDFQSSYDFEWIPESVNDQAILLEIIEKRNSWEESLKKDMYISEAIEVLKDLNKSVSGNFKIANIKK